MTRKTDIKRLWDVLMILKQQEGLDKQRGKFALPTGRKATPTEAAEGGSLWTPESKEPWDSATGKGYSTAAGGSVGAFQTEEGPSAAYPKVWGTSPGKSKYAKPKPKETVTSSDLPEVDASSEPSVSDAHKRQIAGDPYLQWRKRQDIMPTESKRHEQQLAKDPFVQGVRGKGGGGRPAPKLDSQLPLALSSVKKSNESRILKIFKKYGF